MTDERSTLLSPPRDWPASAKKCTKYVAKVLRGKRMRLVELAGDDHLAMLAGVQLNLDDACNNAIRVQEHTGWQVLSGFALYERADVDPDAADADRFVGVEHFWNVNPRGLWIDATPRKPEHQQLVLVESSLTIAPEPPAPCMWCRSDRCLAAKCMSGADDASAATPVSPRVRLFALEVHQSVIADVRDTLERLYGGLVTVDAWMITTRAFLLGFEEAKDVKHINAHSWHGISPERMAAFRREYSATLAKYDGFIVTHTLTLALLYEPLGKPIVAVNTCRYDQPMCWSRDCAFFEQLNESLAAMQARGQLRVISNNKADAAYLHLGCGLDSPVLPSLCCYTKAEYTGRRKEWVLMGADVVPPSARGRLITARQAFGDGAFGEGRKYEWQDLCDMQGVVVLPYEVSTMTIFELYSANVPLLVPDATLLRKLGCVASLAHYGGGASYGRPCRGGARAYSQLASAASIDFFIKRADFYDTHPDAMPHVQTFRSMDELGKLLATMDTRKISAAVKEGNRLRAVRVRSGWRCLMQEAFPVLRGISSQEAATAKAADSAAGAPAAACTSRDDTAAEMTPSAAAAAPVLASGGGAPPAPIS